MLLLQNGTVFTLPFQRAVERQARPRAVFGALNPAKGMGVSAHQHLGVQGDPESEIRGFKVKRFDEGGTYGMDSSMGGDSSSVPYSPSYGVNPTPIDLPPDALTPPTFNIPSSPDSSSASPSSSSPSSAAAPKTGFVGWLQNKHGGITGANWLKALGIASTGILSGIAGHKAQKLPAGPQQYAPSFGQTQLGVYARGGIVAGDPSLNNHYPQGGTRYPNADGPGFFASGGAMTKSGMGNGYAATGMPTRLPAGYPQGGTRYANVDGRGFAVGGVPLPPPSYQAVMGSVGNSQPPNMPQKMSSGGICGGCFADGGSVNGKANYNKLTPEQKMMLIASGAVQSANNGWFSNLFSRDAQHLTDLGGKGGAQNTLQRAAEADMAQRHGASYDSSKQMSPYNALIGAGWFSPPSIVAKDGSYSRGGICSGGSYAGGGTTGGGMLQGPGDGMSDQIPANGGGVRVSPGEYVLDADTVSNVGNGDSAAGARKIDAARQALRQKKTGKRTQPPRVMDHKNPLLKALGQ